MKKLLFTLFLFCSFFARSQDQTYLISRYEQTGDQLFICLTSLKTPCYVEHFFTPDEKMDSTTIKMTIAGLIAQLQVSDSLYVPPVPVVDRVNRAKRYQIDPALIHQKRIRINKILPQKQPAMILYENTVNDSILINY